METDVRALYDQHQRIHVADALSVREEADGVVRYIWHAEKAGAVLHARLTPDTADAAIAAQIARFRALGYDFEWKHYSHDSPPDMKERLRRHGLSEEEDEAVMVLRIAQAPSRLTRRVPHDVRKATTPEDFAAADRVHHAVWGGDGSAVTQRIWPRYVRDPEGVSLYVAYVDGVAAAFARVEFPRDNPFASLWGGSTVAQHRGHGLYTALVATRLQEAMRRGRSYLTVDAKPDTSMPILASLGFVTIGHTTAFTLSPAAERGVAP